MPVDLLNIGQITPATSPLAVNGSLNLVGTAPVPQFLINGVPIGTSAFVDPTTTLGDLIVRGASATTRLAVGTNGQVLLADSAQTLGLHWVTLTSDHVNLNPNINAWGTVQVAITNLNTASPASVLTTLGDILGRNATGPARLAVGTNGQVLEADSAQPLGVHWVTPPATPASILTTLGDIIVRGAAAPTRLGIGTNGQALLADSTQTNGLHWATMTADLVNLNPTVGTWTTVQNAISNISTALTVLARGMAYVGHFNGATGAATFVPSMSSLDGPIPAANATGIEEGDFLVVTTAGTYNSTPVVVGDQLISGGPTGGPTWIILPIGANMASVTAATVPLAPVIGTWTTVQVALTDLSTSARPAGAVGQIQFNAGGTPNVFGASTNLFWDSANNRLGVNVAAPLYSLHVNGESQLCGAASALYAIPGFNVDLTAALNGNIASQQSFRINGSGVTVHASGTNVGLLADAATGYINFNTNGAERVRIIANGNVGIGNAAPAYALDVTGAINATAGFYVNGVLYAEPGSAHIKATSITGIDGEPIEIHGELSHNGRKINLDAVLERLEQLENALAALKS